MVKTRWSSTVSPVGSRSASTPIFLILTATVVFFLFLAFAIYAFAPAPVDWNLTFSALGHRVHSRKHPPAMRDAGIPYVGRFGEMMVAMLGEDLPFTLFVPSEAAFLKFSNTFQKISESGDDLNSIHNDTQQMEDVYAILSRVLSFCAVPKHIFSSTVPTGAEMEADALSGYKLYLSRVPGRGLLVNNLECEHTDLRRGLFIIHVLNGVLLDPEFGRSIELENAAADDMNEPLAELAKTESLDSTLPYLDLRGGHT